MNQLKFEQTKIPIVEIFNSISGEGISSGEIVSFVRVAGCNLRCNYCDTKYSYDDKSSENLYLSPLKIIDKLQKIGCNSIICTGGEPLEFDKTKRYLPLYLSSKGFNVRIETNGSCPLYDEEEISEFIDDEKLLVLHYTLDVKSPSSGMKDYNIFEENFTRLRAEDEIKFVVGTEEDIHYSMKIIHQYKQLFSENNIILNFSPVFNQIEPSKIVEILKEQNEYFQKHNLKVRLSLQIHKYIWPPEARGV